MLDIFTRLNDEGRTIVMITHEQHVAETARRVIRLSDGRVVDDFLHARRPRSRAGSCGERRHDAPCEALRMAVQGLISNRLRTLLTMLGITIGVASVIVLVAVGHGSAVKVNSQIESLGTNTLTVMPSGGFGFGGRGGSEQHVAAAHAQGRRGARGQAAGPGHPRPSRRS